MTKSLFDTVRGKIGLVKRSRIGGERGAGKMVKKKDQVFLGTIWKNKGKRFD